MIPKGWRSKLLAFIGVLTVVLGLAYVARPVGHIPLYDANLNRLAETQLQGYCAGETFYRTNGNLDGDADMAAECRETRRGVMPDKYNLRAVEAAFCAAIIEEGWAGTIADCLTIMGGSQYWPTYDGGLTWAWNRARPYPRALLTAPAEDGQSDSRTGSRNAPTRANPGTPPAAAPTTTETTTTTTETETTSEEETE